MKLPTKVLITIRRYAVGGTYAFKDKLHLKRLIGDSTLIGGRMANSQRRDDCGSLAKRDCRHFPILHILNSARALAHLPPSHAR